VKDDYPDSRREDSQYLLLFYTPLFSSVLLPFGMGLEKNFGLFWMLLLDVVPLCSTLLTLAQMEVLRPHSRFLNTILVPSSKY
jgi:hypothetical protein